MLVALCSMPHVSVFTVRLLYYCANYRHIILPMYCRWTLLFQNWKFHIFLKFGYKTDTRPHSNIELQRLVCISNSIRNMIIYVRWNKFEYIFTLHSHTHNNWLQYSYLHRRKKTWEIIVYVIGLRREQMNMVWSDLCRVWVSASNWANPSCLVQ